MVTLTKVSDRMFDLPDDDLAIIVPTHNREESLFRLVASQQRHARTVPIHAVRHPDDEYDHPHVTMWESDTFPIGGCYRAVADRIDAEAYLFLDDDHSLSEGFDVATLRDAWQSYPAWSLPIRSDAVERTVRDAAKCGGQLVRADAYADAGGHGDDYLEDIELSLRLSWNGTPPKRYPEKVTTHHQGIDGGYRTHSQIDEYATSEERLSRLADRYDRVERSPTSYYGYREVR